jgi:hypothetical protein
MPVCGCQHTTPTRWSRSQHVPAHGAAHGLWWRVRCHRHILLSFHSWLVCIAERSTVCVCLCRSHCGNGSVSLRRVGLLCVCLCVGVSVKPLLVCVCLCVGVSVTPLLKHPLYMRIYPLCVCGCVCHTARRCLIWHPLCMHMHVSVVCVRAGIHSACICIWTLCVCCVCLSHRPTLLPSASTLHACVRIRCVSVCGACVCHTTRRCFLWHPLSMPHVCVSVVHMTRLAYSSTTQLLVVSVSFSFLVLALFFFKTTENTFLLLIHAFILSFFLSFFLSSFLSFFLSFIHSFIIHNSFIHSFIHNGQY